MGDDKQTKIDGTNTKKRPPIAGVRFSLSESPFQVKAPKVLKRMKDDAGVYFEVEATFHITLTKEEAAQLPQFGAAMFDLIASGTALPKEAKNSFTVAPVLDYAGAKYTVKGKPGGLDFNGQVKRAKGRVTKGDPMLILTLVAILRQKDHDTLTKYIADKGKLTVEPPQQGLDIEA